VTRVGPVTGTKS